ncbi:MAG: endonuclease III domain-containing protein [Spirochaetes bacterium]|nr:endonuclease III domain-containing protein [Spirochaetota bacterium]
MSRLLQIYNSMLNFYGPQGWWPLTSCKNGSKKTDEPDNGKGYHPGDYSFPKNSRQRFEICIGAVLTQNTAWTNVEKALVNLRENKLLSANSIKKADVEILKKSIKPAGYYNQKSVYLKELADFFISLKGKVPARGELMNVKGIGPETADSILLYAYNQLEFVVDNYTKRIFSETGFFDKSANYHKIKEIFISKLPEDIVIYQEFHALIVLHAKLAFAGGKTGFRKTEILKFN